MGTHNYNWAGLWLIAGFMAGIAASFFLVSVWRSEINGKRKWFLFATALAFLCIASLFYWLRGQPKAIDASTNMMWPADHAALSTGSDAGADSMQQAAERLAAKLAKGSGRDADWQLLQQAYQFVGDTQGAALASQHRLRDAAGAVPAVATSSTANEPAAKLAPFVERVANNDKDAEAWLTIAELQRTARNFSESVRAYDKVIALKAMTASAWADYADAQASSNGTLGNPNTRSAIEAALKLEPKHPKALWLKASMEYDEHRYAEALAVWQQLLTALPPGSPDTKVIQANIDEARSLLGQKTPASADNSVARISGHIELDAAIKDKVVPGMTLFVFAKPNDGLGMPAAVLRVPVNAWPVEFALDDSQAMMPSRKLSQFQTVTVQARLSRSGQAQAQPGDLQTDAVSVATQAAQPLILHLSQVVNR